MIYQIIKGKITSDYFVYVEGIPVMRVKTITDKMKVFMNAKSTLHGLERGDYTMSDLISRQYAIEALEEHLDYLQKLNKDENPTARSKWYGVNWARNTIADLPSAQKKGGCATCAMALSCRCSARTAERI